MSIEVYPGLTEALKKKQSCSGIGWLIGTQTESKTQFYAVAKCLAVDPGSIYGIESLDSAAMASDLDCLCSMLPYGFRVLGCIWLPGELQDSLDAVVPGLASCALEIIQNKSKAMHYSPARTYMGVWDGEQLKLADAESNQQIDVVLKEGSFSGVIMNCKIQSKVPVYISKGDRSEAAWEEGVKSAMLHLKRQWQPTVFQQCLNGSASEKRYRVFEQGGTEPIVGSSSVASGWVEVLAGTLNSQTKATSSNLVLEFRTPEAGKEWTISWCKVDFSFIAFAEEGSPEGEVESLLQSALLNMVQCSLTQILKFPYAKEFGWYHFSPPGLLLPVSLMFPNGAQEEDLYKFRDESHRRFYLPDDRPIFRKSCAITNSMNQGTNNPKKGCRLQDVHIYVKSSGVNGGNIGMVDGSYDYYHYMQDKFNDNGWGCAYRSLQTVFSWFLHQHYTDQSVPSHKKIQETLVDIGDKDPSFVGSREWIGSIEVGFVLDELLNVGNRVVMKRADQDPSSVALELINHFKTQGTPVSIGGGVLAYTLLGVQVNETTGESAFLILDPHYTGEDDIDKICRGGWIAWKRPTDKAAAGGPLFAPNTFYNFLCPQRPKLI